MTGCDLEKTQQFWLWAFGQALKGRAWRQGGFYSGLFLLLGKWSRATCWVPFPPLLVLTRTGCTAVGGRKKEKVRDLEERGESPTYQEVGVRMGEGSSLFFPAPKNKERHQNITLPLCLLLHLNCSLLWKAEFCLLELEFHKSPFCLGELNNHG